MHVWRHDIIPAFQFRSVLPPGAASSSAGRTELIFKLERQGEGWGEEILPRLIVEQRPLERRRVRNRCSLPDPWAVRPCAWPVLGQVATYRSGTLFRPRPLLRPPACAIPGMTPGVCTVFARCSTAEKPATRLATAWSPLLSLLHTYKQRCLYASCICQREVARAVVPPPGPSTCCCPGYDPAACPGSLAGSAVIPHASSESLAACPKGPPAAHRPRGVISISAMSSMMSC